MVLPDLVGIFVDPLEALGLPYMITGGVASVIYGDPRFTRDIDIVHLLSDDALHTWGFQRRRRLALGERTVSVAPPEYVILRKLEYYARSTSERHLRDIAMMLRISPEMIDAEGIADLADDLGLTDEWGLARDFEPPS